MEIRLSRSVGKDGINNAEDVLTVQERLNELGFEFIGSLDGIIGSKTIRAIRLFQSIKNGSQTLGGDGRVDVDGDTHKWLNATNAPRWQTMTDRSEGLINVEVTQQLNDHHDFGTNWLDETIQAAARQYERDYRDAHNASLLTVNDTSFSTGGNTPDHSGHETGLSCDLRLSQTNNAGTAPGGRTHESSDYDRNATRMILVALNNQPLANPRSIYFNDPYLITEGLCKKASGHDDHIHFQIKPPTRQD